MDKKYIWIIGASSGIGAALAIEYANMGCQVAVSSRSASQLEENIKLLHGKGHIAMAFDVSDYQQVLNSVQKLSKVWPRVDKIIYMAGIYEPMKIGSLDLSLTQAIVHVNLLGAINVVEATLGFLKSSKAQLAVCASIAGYFGMPNSQPYGATKAALINFVESLYYDHGKDIDIRLINPGFVKSRLTDKNSFHMPMQISAKTAANYIVKGLDGRGFEIHFPRAFSFLMKLLALLPYCLRNLIKL